MSLWREIMDEIVSLEYIKEESREVCAGDEFGPVSIKGNPERTYGLVHAIYGRGKGKTTAALGMAVRSAGYGLNVSLVQFMKNGQSNEINALRYIPNLDYYCPGDHQWASIENGLLESQKNHALDCLEYVLDTPETTNLLVCDEILNVPLFGMNGNRPFSYEDIADCIKSKRSDLELVLTGLYLPENLKGLIDYASEIHERKHPFKRGISARPGIEY
jgi:cob(I)alamin adenosyltransferase